MYPDNLANQPQKLYQFMQNINPLYLEILHILVTFKKLG